MDDPSSFPGRPRPSTSNSGTVLPPADSGSMFSTIQKTRESKLRFVEKKLSEVGQFRNEQEMLKNQAKAERLMQYQQSSEIISNIHGRESEMRDAKKKKEIEFNERALFTAIRTGNKTTVNLLLTSSKTSPNCREEGTRDWAVQCAVQSGKLPIVQLLVENGASVNVFNPSNKTTPVHDACALDNAKILEYLLSLGAVPDLVDAIGRTPLHVACEYGCLESVQILWAKLFPDARSFSLQDIDGRTPLHLALASDRHNIADWLISELARCLPRPQVSFLLSLQDTISGFSPLHLACRSPLTPPDLTITLCELGARVFCVDSEGNTPADLFLSYHDCADERPVLETLIKFDVGFVERVGEWVERRMNLEKMARRNSAASTSTTTGIPTPFSTAGGGGGAISVQPSETSSFTACPRGFTELLHIACELGLYPVVQEFVSRTSELAINLDIPDPMGRTPLHIALLRRDLSTVRLLLQGGADPNFPLPGPGHLYPIEVVSDDYGVLSAFFEHQDRLDLGIYVNRPGISTCDEKITISQRILLYAPPDHALNFLTKVQAAQNVLDSGRTLVYELCSLDRWEILRALLRGENSGGLDSARERGGGESGGSLNLTLGQKALNRLNGDDEGEAPIHLAAKRGDVDLIRLLIDLGSHPDLCDSKFGYTPLMFSIACGHFDSAVELLKLGADPLYIKKSKQSENKIECGFSEVIFQMFSGVSALSLCVRTGNVRLFEYLISPKVLRRAAPAAASNQKILIDYVNCVDVEDNNLGSGSGLSPLHFAVQTRDLSLISRLIELGAQIDIHSRPFVVPQTPPVISARPRSAPKRPTSASSQPPQRAAASAILQPSPELFIYDRIRSRLSPSSSAKTNSARSESSEISEIVPQTPQTPLSEILAGLKVRPIHLALSMGDRECLRALLQGGANPNWTMGDEVAPFEVACYSHFDDFFHFITSYSRIPFFPDAPIPFPIGGVGVGGVSNNSSADRSGVGSGVELRPSGSRSESRCSVLSVSASVVVVVGGDMPPPSAESVGGSTVTSGATTNREGTITVDSTPRPDSASTTFHQPQNSTPTATSTTITPLDFAIAHSAYPLGDRILSLFEELCGGWKVSTDGGGGSPLKSTTPISVIPTSPTVLPVSDGGEGEGEGISATKIRFDPTNRDAFFLSLQRTLHQATEKGVREFLSLWNMCLVVSCVPRALLTLCSDAQSLLVSKFAKSKALRSALMDAIKSINKEELTEKERLLMETPTVSPLFDLVQCGDLLLLRTLTLLGFTPLLCDKYGRSPLFLAVENKRNEIVAFLVNRYSEEQPCILFMEMDTLGTSSLHLTIRTRNDEALSFLLSHPGCDIYLPDKHGKSALSLVLESGDPEFLKNFAKKCKNFDVNRPCGKEGETALHRCVISTSGGNTMIEILKFCMGQGSNPCLLDSKGKSAVHYAAELSNLEAAREILDLKYYENDFENREKVVNTRESVEGCTALHLAAEKGDVKMCELLCECGADLLIKNERGESPLVAASKARKHEIVDLLGQHAQTKFGKNAQNQSDRSSDHMESAKERIKALENIVRALQEKEGQMAEGGEESATAKIARLESELYFCKEENKTRIESMEQMQTSLQEQLTTASHSHASLLSQLHESESRQNEAEQKLRMVKELEHQISDLTDRVRARGEQVNILKIEVENKGKMLEESARNHEKNLREKDGEIKRAKEEGMKALENYVLDKTRELDKIENENILRQDEMKKEYETKISEMCKIIDDQKSEISKLTQIYETERSKCEEFENKFNSVEKEFSDFRSSMQIETQKFQDSRENFENEMNIKLQEQKSKMESEFDEKLKIFEDVKTREADELKNELENLKDQKEREGKEFERVLAESLSQKSELEGKLNVMTTRLEASDQICQLSFRESVMLMKSLPSLDSLFGDVPVWLNAASASIRERQHQLSMSHGEQQGSAPIMPEDPAPLLAEISKAIHRSRDTRLSVTRNWTDSPADTKLAQVFTTLHSSLHTLLSTFRYFSPSFAIPTPAHQNQPSTADDFASPLSGVHPSPTTIAKLDPAVDTLISVGSAPFLSSFFPASWAECPGVYSEFEIPIGDSEFKAIGKLLNDSSAVGEPLARSAVAHHGICAVVPQKFEVLKVVRIQNVSLWTNYTSAKHAVLENMSARFQASAPLPVCTQLLDERCREHYLFFGAARGDLSPKFSGFSEKQAELGNMGHGIYFYENASEAHAKSRCVSQSHGSDSCVFSMLVCRVPLGNYFPALLTNRDDPNKYKSMVRPPLLPAPEEGTYDTIVGLSKRDHASSVLPNRQFVVCDRSQAYPEYLVLYRPVGASGV